MTTHQRRRRTGRGPVSVVVAAAFVVALATPGCRDDTRSTASSSTVTDTIIVSAAASLTEAFTDIGAGFERANPGAGVRFNFGSSASLETQIQQGAPADVFASADAATMQEVVTAGLAAGEPAVFARNRLVIVTQPGNPERVEDLADLERLDIVSLCGPEVPCGTYADQVLAAAGVTVPNDRITRSQDVKTTLGAVATGDADAAIVYVTDARSAGDTVHTVTIPDALNTTAAYPIAVIEPSGKAATARAFVDFVTGPKGRATMRSYGFLPPERPAE